MDGAPALLTDLYQLTMAHAVFHAGLWDTEAVFHLTFRKAPWSGGFTVACGLEPALQYLERYRFDESDLAYLGSLQAEGAPLFDAAFLDALRKLRLSVDVDGIPEGTVVYPQEPLLRVRGPIAQCMLLETPLLNVINFETLIATKAARVCLAARGDPVSEFGLRRAQGPDGAVSASRAAYVGGVSSTSNVLAGKQFGIPVRGTHAHSWVMLFDQELDAFLAYARAQPRGCTFLVDTYDTLQGVDHAIEAARALRKAGHELAGIRLDSGDLAWLSIEARRRLDAAGFPKTAIIASNDLDENLIGALKEQGARITVWGVGTRLVTAHGESALGGVYKLSAMRKPGGPWQHRIKLSEQTVKVSTPGVLQVRRFHRPDGALVADMIFDEERGEPTRCIVDPLDPTRRKTIAADTPYEDLLVPALRQGKRVAPSEPLEVTRARTHAQLGRLDFTHKRFVNPHTYPVGLEQHLHEFKTRLILERRGVAA